MKTIKKALVIVMIFSALLAAVPTPAAVRHPHLNVIVSHNAGRYTARVYHFGRMVARYNFKRRPKIVYTTPGRMNYHTLTHRKNKVLLIEVVTGTKLNAAGDGKIDIKGPYNYISYRYVPWARVNSRILSYMIYNPANNYEDDIHCRLDQGL